MIASDDLRRCHPQGHRRGRKVLADPMEILGFGKYVAFFDTEGNRTIHPGA
jgi:predicted enzyme related to lactoylglutathione lyase